MWGLFFEVRAKPGHLDAYFEHVERLKPALARHEGLLYLERFRCLDDDGVLLSHQHWRDGAAIDGWRADPAHRVSQAAGRQRHFEDYRIRVGPECAPGGADAAVLAAYGTAPVAGAGLTGFESVTRAGRYVTLAAPGAGVAARLRDAEGIEALHAFAARRDYGLHDRARAPSN